jgi:hypothetical protein
LFKIDYRGLKCLDIIFEMPKALVAVIAKKTSIVPVSMTMVYMELVSNAAGFVCTADSAFTSLSL